MEMKISLWDTDFIPFTSWIYTQKRNCWSYGSCIFNILRNLQAGFHNGHTNLYWCCCSVAKSGLTLCDPWTAAHQASLFFTISQSLLRLMFLFMFSNSCLNSCHWYHPTISHYTVYTGSVILFWQCIEYLRRRQWHPLQYSCLENPMDGGAWKAAVHGVAEGQTRLSDFTSTFHFPA